MYLLKPKPQADTLKVVILDHYSRTIYTNVTDKEFLEVELQLRNSEAMHYNRMSFKCGSTLEIPETYTFVTRTNGVYWVDIVGDYIP